MEEKSHNSHIYNHDFYEATHFATRCSAEKISSMVMDLFSPKSVIDIGCGNGIWLSEFDKHESIEKIAGIDGNSIPEKELLIPSKYFTRADLETDFSSLIEEKYDIAICMEVAEHISSEKAHTFIESLTKTADIIIFSAAIPFQKGVCHINENWPEYWASIFKQFSFLPVDCIRKEIWNDDNIAFWYRQNAFVFTNKTVIQKYFPYYDEAKDRPLFSAIHPYLFFNLLGKSIGEDAYLSNLDFYQETIDAAQQKTTFPKHTTIHNLSSKLDDALLEKEQWMNAFHELNERYEKETKISENQTVLLQNQLNKLVDEVALLKQKNQELESARRQYHIQQSQFEKLFELFVHKTNNPELTEQIQQLLQQNRLLEESLQKEKSITFEQSKQIQKIEVENVLLQERIKKEDSETC